MQMKQLSLLIDKLLKFVAILMLAIECLFSFFYEAFARGGEEEEIHNKKIEREVRSISKSHRSKREKAV